MVRACVERAWCECGEQIREVLCVRVRGAKREERKQMVRACVERAWCERGKQIREVLCVLYAPTLFLCFAFFGYGITQEPTE